MVELRQQAAVVQLSDKVFLLYAFSDRICKCESRVAYLVEILIYHSRMDKIATFDKRKTIGT